MCHDMTVMWHGTKFAFMHKLVEVCTPPSIISTHQERLFLPQMESSEG